MPVYEYRCNRCRRKVTLLVRGFSPPSRASCSLCGSEDLTRLFSSFAIHKPDKDIYEDILSDSRLVRGMLENDPRALVEWSRRIGEATGEGTSPEYEEMMQRMERGERWEDIVSEMQQKELGSAEEKTSELAG